MTMGVDSDEKTDNMFYMTLRELVQTIDVPYRKAQTVLESGHADRWVPRGEGSGRHRDFGPAEAFAFALLMRLRTLGFATAKAAGIVTLLEEGVRTVAQGLVWDPSFHPFRGRLQTTELWLAEVGDGHLCRLGTTANPSKRGLQWFDWTDAKRKTVQEARPLVTVRIDLAQLAKLIGETFGPEG